jgi:putative DNA primase/helicase
LSVKIDDDAPEGFVVHSFAGDDEIVCRDHVRTKLGLPPFKARKKNGGDAAWTLISEHVYRDEFGAPYLRVRRCLDGEGKKQYPQSKWDGAQWIKGKPRGAKIPYRLPELLAAPAATIVYIAEGEKCADVLAKLGFVATTNSEGAGKWLACLNGYFKDRNVVILADNDLPGRKHVQLVARNLDGVALSVRTLDLAQHWPGEAMPEGFDVAEWIERHDRAGSRLAQLAKDAPIWEPEAASAGAAGQPVVLPSPAVPMTVAREFLKQAHTFDDGIPTLRHWRGGWWIWRMSYWGELDERTMRAQLYTFTENAIYLDEEGDGKPWAPNRRRITDLTDALSAICILPANFDQPRWLDSRETGIIVAVANGLLDIEQQQLYSHTPLFFNQTAVPCDYNPEAPAPAEWLAFLKKLWPSEPTAIKVVGEWYGYVISGRLDLHKIFMTVGPTRGGKGIIVRILIALIGRQNTCGPTLNSLGGEFGLAPLIGKPLGVISDARFVSKNSNVVVERLLSISGEDTLTVNRKYREQWTGKLPTRLHVVSNELPRLGDASSAIIGRIVLLILTESWLGREDHGLEARLLTELTGILNWALEGLYRLTVENKNAFTPTASAVDAIVTMRDLASPVAAFVREKCELGSAYQIGRDDLYSAYKAWCEANGHPRPTKEILGRDLRAAFSSIRATRPREDEARHLSYAGIRLRSASGGYNPGPPGPPGPDDALAHVSLLRV